MTEKHQPKKTTDTATIEKAIARGKIYQLLSISFLYPEQELFSLMKEGRFTDELEECIEAFNEGGSLHKALDGLAAYIKAQLTISSFFSDLQAQHRRVFGHTASCECPPYETQYGSGHIFQQAQEMGDIVGFYRAFGLEVSENSKERLDHISVELEFMHFLSFKETYALENGHGDEKVEICVEAQKEFLKEHLGRWVPFFVKLLSKKAGDGFYKELATLTGDFVSLEKELLGVKPQDINKLKPITLEPEGSCFSCEISDLCFLNESNEEGAQ